MGTTQEAPLSAFVSGQMHVPGEPLPSLLQRTLKAIREHLGMDVAFVSEFTGGRRVFRYVDAKWADQPVRVGGSDPLEESYCQRILDGRLPELITDATRLPAALELPVTLALPVGAHLSVPLRLKNGSVYGTFCCFSFTPDSTLNRRDLAMMRVIADFAAEQIERDLEETRVRAEAGDRIRRLLAGNGLAMAYQPIVDTAADRICGYEALARISAPPQRAPDVWFREAAEAGCGPALEAKAIGLALRVFDELSGDVYISVNASPEAIRAGAVTEALEGQPLDRILLEITEHAAIHHYSEIREVVEPLRARGLRIAVDDAGSGYASFRHILALAPDVIKLDISITRNIDSDASRQALAAALAGFARATGSEMIAEGVETAAELEMLRAIGIGKVQGYFVGRPSALPRAGAWHM